jgi:exonuclease SbcC
MRPLKLILEGFKPFKTRQEIDFSPLNFFVIRGPTGSGKSSILEAMLFALFGETPERLNQDELINKNSGGFYIDFTFSVGNTVYRIERRRRLGKSGEARLYVNGVRRALRSEAIKKEIQNILGVGAKQFKKIFYLPQGRYAEFFHSEPAQRRELIVSLLDLEIYKRLGERIKEEWDKLAKEIAQREGELRALEEYTPQRKKEYEEKKRSLELQKEKLEKLLGETQKRLNHLRELEKLFLQKEELEGKLKTLLEGEYPTLRERVENLRPLRELLPLLERYRLKEEELVKLRRVREKLIATLKGLEEKLHRAAGELEGLRQREEELQRRKKEVERFKEFRGILELLEPKYRDLKRLKANLLERQRLLEKKLRELEKISSELQKVESQLFQLRQRLEKLDYSPEEELQLRLLLQRAKERQELLAEFQRLKEELSQLEEKINSLGEELRGKEQLLREVENSLKEKEKEFALYLLTRDLKEGEPCPVCGRPLEGLKGCMAGDIKAEEIEKLRKQEESLKREIEQKRALLHRWEARVEELLRRLEEIGQKLSQLEEIPPVGELKEKLEKLLRLKEEREQTERLLKQLEERKNLLTAQTASLEGEIMSEKEALKREQENLNSQVGEIRETLTGIYRNLNLKPPKGENPFTHLKEVLEKKIASFEREEESLRRIVGEKEREISALKMALAREKELLSETEKAIENLLQELEELKNEMSQKGWNGQEPSHLLEQLKKLPHWEERLKGLEAQISAVKEALKRLEGQIGPTEPQILKDIPLLEEELKGLEKELSHTLAELGSVGSKLKEFEQKLGKKSLLQKELAELYRKEALLRTLKEDFRSDRLIDFVVNRAVEDIVNLAGEYLFNLSQRYRLLNRGGEIYVLDLFEDTQRSVKTLSGGETFLASLSLALALGDYAGSGGKVESLFIDEGFGTLDKERLEKIGTLFEKLKLSLNKVVGVVTHLEELAEYFDQRIEVIPSAEGSKVKVIL